MKRIVIIVVMLAVLGAGGFFLYQRAQASKQAQNSTLDLQTAPLQEGVLQNTISATGQVRSQQTTDLSWQTSGVIDSVNVKPGDMVKAGDKLATLAQTSLPQAVILAQSNLYDDQQALTDLTSTADLNRIKALNDISTYQQNVRDAQYQLDNYNVPSDIAGMTPEQAVTVTKGKLDQAYQAFLPYKYYPSTDSTRANLLDDLNAAQAEYDSAVKQLQYQYNLEVAQGNLSQAQVNYEKYKNGPDQAQIDAAKAKIASDEATLSQAFIAAPFDGTVTQVDAQVGGNVAAGTSAFQLDNLSALLIDVQVSEVDIDQVKIGQPVTVTFDALRGSSFPGKVTDVAMVSDTTSGAVNFDVTVQLVEPNQGVRPGMTAVVEIVTSQGEKTLLIPNQAVRTINGVQIVMLKKGDNFVSVPVTIGASSDSYSQLVSGDLKAGDLIVLNPPSSTTQTTQNERRFFFGPGGRPPTDNGGAPVNRNNSGNNSSGGSSGGGN
jgi:HlyD family secretion protein